LEGWGGKEAIVNLIEQGGPAHGVGPLEACPTCGSENLVAVAAEDETNFLCECGRCWHVEFARVSRVDPLGCPGCLNRSRCMERARDDALGQESPGTKDRVA
jgi:hypothetical protein